MTKPFSSFSEYSGITGLLRRRLTGDYLVQLNALSLIVKFLLKKQKTTAEESREEFFLRHAGTAMKFGVSCFTFGLRPLGNGLFALGDWGFIYPRDQKDML